jgi:hypothetical protein
VELREGALRLEGGRLILLDTEEPQALRFMAARFQAALREHTGLAWEMVAGRGIPAEQVGLALRVAAVRGARAQSYELTIGPDRIEIVAPDLAGAFYGVCTLVQIVQESRRAEGQRSGGVEGQGDTQYLIPNTRIADHPDFLARGVMLDISRNRAPTMATLYGLADMLAGWKINQLQLYTEHTFAYRQHPEVWADASPLTGEEILALDAFCRQRHIELVPNQNSFGHLEPWLIHPRYRPLAEAPDGCMTRWGRFERPFSLNPLDPGSLALVRSLYDELLPHFTSKLFNVGCDETVDLGEGRSKAACQAQGVGRVYLDFLLKIYREVTARGRAMQFWGDIIMEHPELVPDLPRDAIALEWGYEANHPFAEHGARFAASGIPFYVCPGTATWNSLAGRTDNALGNLLNAAENGQRHGAIGYLVTDWGDNGHWQALPMSYLGFAAGAAYSWALEANRDLDMAEAVGRHAFCDPTAAMGRAAYDLGNVYQAVGYVPHNGSALFQVLRLSRPAIEAHRSLGPLPPAAFEHALVAIEQAAAPLAHSQMTRPDAGLIQREYALTVRLLRHACRRRLWMFGAGAAGSAASLDQDMAEIIAEFRAVWLARSRPGGLADSVGRLERVREDYR